jgi:hypothetical protein
MRQVKTGYPQTAPGSGLQGRILTRCIYCPPLAVHFLRAAGGFFKTGKTFFGGKTMGMHKAEAVLKKGIGLVQEPGWFFHKSSKKRGFLTKPAFFCCFYMVVV